MEHALNGFEIPVADMGWRNPGWTRRWRKARRTRWARSCRCCLRMRVRPLGCFYWGKVWTLAAWCEQRNDFRSFRIDRVGSVQRLDQRFRDEPGRTLADLARLNGVLLQDDGGAVQRIAAAQAKVPR